MSDSSSKSPLTICLPNPNRPSLPASRISRIPWTETEEKLIEEQLREGKRPNEIRLGGRTRNAIQSKVRQIKKKLLPKHSPALTASTSQPLQGKAI